MRPVYKFYNSKEYKQTGSVLVAVSSADTTQSELTLKKDPDAEFGRL